MPSPHGGTDRIRGSHRNIRNRHGGNNSPAVAAAEASLSAVAAASDAASVVAATVLSTVSNTDEKKQKCVPSYGARFSVK